MAELGVILLLLLLAAGAALAAYLFLGPIISGRYRATDPRRSEHRHRP